MPQSKVVAKGRWYEVKASTEVVEAFIYGDIGDSWWDDESITAKSFVDAIAQHAGKRLTVRINSYGGSVSDGVAIFNAMRRHPGGCDVAIDGAAVSIASLIAMAGETVSMAANALFMVHAPWIYASGNAEDLRKEAATLDKFSEAMASSYVTKSGQSHEAIMALLTDGIDHWYTAEEAKAAGFIDVVTGEMSIAASMDLSRYRNAPKPTFHSRYEELPMPKANHTTEEQQGDTVPDQQNQSETPDTDQAIARALAAEKTRREAIRARLGKLCAQNASVQIIMDACMDDPTVTPDAACARALEVMASATESVVPAGYNPRISGGASAQEKFAVGVTAALEARANLAKHDPQNEFRGHSLMELARASLELKGIDTKGMGRLELAEAALPSDGRIRVRASTLTSTSSDFANLLANVANKSMLKGYQEAGETFQKWTTPGTLGDFKPAKRVDLNEFPALARIDEGGEYTIGTVGDRGETVQLATYGKKFTITRQAIINDDLNAFTRIPQKMGRAAIRTIGNMVYAVLTGNAAMSDGTALFHANHHNLLSAAGISTESVAAVMAAMMKQVDADGNVNALNIPMQYLIVPVALSASAWTVANSEYEVGASTKNNTTPNYVRGRFEVIEDARLDASSASIWYASADASLFDTIEVSYLDGNDMPYLEQQPGWDVDGIEFKVRIDAGVKALDWRTLARVG